MTNPQRPLADRMQHIQPFHVMEILARAQQLQRSGRAILHMEVGEPDFPTPAPIVAAGIQALQTGLTKYTPACGLPALRERIAGWYQERFGITIPAQRIVVTPGASGALQLALAALVNPGDAVLLTDPGYPCNRHLVHLLGGIPVSLPVTAATHYQPTATAVEQAWADNTRVALFASPANPTGTCLTNTDLRALHATVTANNGTLIVDEIYQGLTYGQDPHTALAVADSCWVVNSFSKYFGMTGWRLGWLVVPDWAVDAVNRLAQNLFLAPSTPAQYAALAAFDPATLAITEERRLAFTARRDFLLPALRDLGFVVGAEPQGAFYIYADAARFGDDAQQLSMTMLEQAGVAFTPGIDFGEHTAKTHVRFAYTTGLDELAQAMERLEKFLPR